MSLKRILSIGAGCLISLFVLNVQAATIDKLVVFGDSLSDNGNLFALTLAAHKTNPLIPIIPKEPFYYHGRFSNGPIWVDTLASSLGVTLSNFAFAGAWAEPLIDSKLNIPFGLDIQVSFYLVSAALDFHKDKHLFIIWAGANDYVSGRSDPDYATTNTVNVIQNQIDWLVFYGAKHILIMNLPDLGKVPQVMARGPDFSASITELSTMHNQKLAEMLAKEKAVHPDVTFVDVDTVSYLEDVLANPEKYQLKNVQEACYNGGYWLNSNLANNREVLAAKEARFDISNTPSLRVAYLTALSGSESVCQNPDEYLFWDQLHPTRIMHQYISLIVQTMLDKNHINGKKK